MGAVLDLTRELVRTETINPPGNESRAADLVGARLEDAGLDVRRHPLAEGRDSLVAHLPGSGERPALCLTAHLDTVPLGRARWEHEPLAAVVDDGRVYGRGTSDMKGGLAALVTAVERVAALGRGEAGLELVLCAGEETGCEGALSLAGGGALGEVGAVLVAEPTSNYPCVAHKGVVWIDASTSGRSAHGSMPHLGDNAIYKLARAIGRLEGFDFGGPSHELLGSPTLSVGTVAGGVNINSVADGATAGIDVRLVPGLDGDEVIARLGDLLGDEVRLERRVDLPPVATDPGDEWVAEVFAVMEPLIGERPEPRGLAYFTDASALTPAYGTPPTVICGPGDADQAHRRTSRARSSVSTRPPRASSRSPAAGAGSELRGERPRVPRADRIRRGGGRRDDPARAGRPRRHLDDPACVVLRAGRTSSEATAALPMVFEAHNVMRRRAGGVGAASRRRTPTSARPVIGRLRSQVRIDRKLAHRASCALRPRRNPPARRFPLWGAARDGGPRYCA
jgi:succinyl-diaminopimelate desuccinylase